MLPRPGQRRQVGGDDHRGDVAHLHVGVGRQGHPQLRQHVGQALLGERALGGLVAGAVEPDHQAVAHQVVAADPGEVGDIADLLGLGQRAQQQCTGTEQDAEERGLGHDSLARKATG